VKTEEQGQVTVDAFALENLGGLDALPGGRDLDQDALTADACRVIQCDDAVRLLDGGIGVVGEPRVHLSGNAPGNDGQDLFAEGDGQPLESKIRDFLLVRAFAQLIARIFQHAVHNGLILRHLRRGGNQRGLVVRPADETSPSLQCRRCRQPQQCIGAIVQADSWALFLLGRGFPSMRSTAIVYRFFRCGNVNAVSPRGGFRIKTSQQPLHE